MAVGSATPPGLTASVHVSPHADDSPTDHPKCGADLALQPGSWAVGACNATGRYIALNIPTSSALVHITLCDIQVALALPPDLVDDSEWFEPTGSAGAATDGTASESSSGGSSSGGEVAGIVVGALAGAVLVLCAAILAVRYTRWRRQYIARQLSVAAALSGKDVVGSLPPDEKQRASGDGSSSISSLPGSTPPPPSSHTGSGSVPVSAFAAAAAVAASDVPLVGAGGAPPPPSGRGPRRSSEWEMMGEFARATVSEHSWPCLEAAAAVWSGSGRKPAAGRAAHACTCRPSCASPPPCRRHCRRSCDGAGATRIWQVQAARPAVQSRMPPSSREPPLPAAAAWTLSGTSPGCRRAWLMVRGCSTTLFASPGTRLHT